MYVVVCFTALGTAENDSNGDRWRYKEWVSRYQGLGECLLGAYVCTCMLLLTLQVVPVAVSSLGTRSFKNRTVNEAISNTILCYVYKFYC